MLSKKRISLILILVSFCTLSAQEYFIGRLIDVESKQPVIFANILVKGTAKGVISNEDGGFRIPYGYINSNNELLISSMGYETITVYLDEFHKEDVNIIRMRPKINQLQEATVTGYKSASLARKIVRKAIRKIPDNFPKKPFALVGYYRDYQKQKSTYINLNEAIVEIQDKGFGKKDFKTTNYKIYHFSKNNNFARDSISGSTYDYENYSKIIDHGYLRSYDGNELLILRVHDAIRNYDYGAYSFVGKLKRDLLPNHSFSMGRDVFLDGKWLYSINLVTHKANTVATGTLLISKENYSIYKLEYTVRNDDKSLSFESDLTDREQGGIIFEVRCEYRPINGKMYLNYVSFSNNFSIRLPPAFKVEDIVVDIYKKEIRVYLNAPFEIESAKDSFHYELSFSDKKVPVKVLVDRSHDKIVNLEPIFETEEKENLFYNEIYERYRRNDSIPLKLNLLGLKDIYGNEIGQHQKKKYLQFREFFTQKTFFSMETPKNRGFYMDKTKPLDENFVEIFNNQEIQDYWMNTPLKD